MVTVSKRKANNPQKRAGRVRSEYPFNFIPTGAVSFEACDTASTSGDICVVKGMYVDGVFHVQEVIKKKEQDNE